MENRKIFFTGFPGFIGKNLIRAIVQKYNCGFVLLVERRFEKTAREEIAKIFPNNENITIVAGDITHPKLDLDHKQYSDLLTAVTDIFHLAAVYDLAVPETIARKVNIEGTQNIIEFAKQVQNLKKFVYFSTCFVAGKLAAKIYEDELPTGQQFHNHYEATKHAAEAIVRNNLEELPTNIIRPAIVVGDSKTGETQKFDGPYFLLIFIDRMKPFLLPLPYIGASAVKGNVVPLDFVVQATIKIWIDEENRGKCYALADPNPPIVKDVYREAIRLMKGKGPWGRIPPSLVKFFLSFSAIRNFVKVPIEMVDYFNFDVQFDCRNTNSLLEDSTVSCPLFLSYLPKMVEFYQANKHRNELYCL